MKKKKEELRIIVNNLPGGFIVYNAHSMKERELVGRACTIEQIKVPCKCPKCEHDYEILLGPHREALLWDIETIKTDTKDYRRRGYATAMLDALKNRVDAITTTNYSEAGLKLCLKQGFKTEVSDKGNQFLVWRRNAIQNDKKGRIIQGNFAPRNEKQKNDKSKSKKTDTPT